MKNFKKLGVLLLVVLLLSGCGKVAKLKNGKDAVVTFKNKAKISVDDLYDNMKKDFALQSLITMIDKYVLEHEFKSHIKDSEEYAKNYVQSLEESYGSKSELLKALQQSGYSTIKAYQKSIYLSDLQKAATETYAKTIVTDNDIKKYYDEQAKGDIEISHILITADIKEDMSDEEKTAAEDKAKDKVKKLIKELKESKNLSDTFTKLAKENSEDAATKSKGGALGKVTYGDLSKEYDELLDAAYSIKDGEVYDKVVTTELGYHVVMKTKSYEKDSLKEMKDEIKDILAKDLVDNTEDITFKAMQHYRKKYKLNIEDSDLKDQYEDYITRLKASYATDDTETEEND